MCCKWRIIKFSTVKSFVNITKLYQWIQPGSVYKSQFWVHKSKKSSSQTNKSSPCDSNHPSWHHSDQVLLDWEESSMRSAIAERNAKALGATQSDVHPEFTRRTQDTKCQQIGSAASQSLELKWNMTQKNNCYCRQSNGGNLKNNYQCKMYQNGKKK